MMVVNGYSQSVMAMRLGIDEKVLRKHYRDVLDKAKADIDAAVTNAIVLNAIGGPNQKWEKSDFRDRKLYAECKMGWKPPRQETDVQIAGPKGGPVQFAPMQIITSDMTPKQAADLYARTIDNDEG